VDNIISSWQVIAGIAAITIILITLVIAISKTTSSREKGAILNQIGILADELDRQKKENLSLRNDMRRIESLDNLFFASLIRLTSRLDPIEIARETSGLLANCLDAHEVAVFLYDEKSKRLNIGAQHGLNENWVPKIVYELSEGRVGATAEKRIPIGVREAQILRIKEPYPIFEPDICYPLVYQNRLKGVVALIRNGELDERERSLLGVVSSITAVALQNASGFEELRDVAALDPLTKLLNVGSFKERLNDELNRARRFQHDLSVTIIDLDNFKDYNDTYGHQAGDQLLIQLAKVFQKHFHDTDTVARYGGDEFIVMCPETKKPDAAHLTSGLLTELEMYNFVPGKSGKKITFSAGVSAFPEDGGAVSELIKSADEALYEAKSMGRNRVQQHIHKIEKI